MKHSKIDKYRLPNESDVSWALRKLFIERYKGDFQEETLLSLAKAYSDVELGRCSKAVSASPVGPVATQHEQSDDSCKKKAAKSAKEKRRTLAYSGSKTSVKMKQKASATRDHKSSGASSKKRTSHKAFQENSQKEDGVLHEVPTKKSRGSDLNSYSEGSGTSRSIMSKADNDVTVEYISLPSLLKNQLEESGTCEEVSELDTVDEVEVIAYSLGEKVLEINTWPQKLKRNFINILQFVRKCLSKELFTSEILQSMSKRFKLRLQYCTKELPLVENYLPMFECALMVESVQLGKGNGSTLKKARIAAAKEVIDKLVKLSQEVENLSYFNTCGKSVEHMKSIDENVYEIDDANMNSENELVELVNEFDSTSDGYKETHCPRGDVSIPCQHGLSQGRCDTQCEGGRQNSLRSMVQVNCPTSTEDLGSDVTYGMGIKPTLNVDSRSHVLPTAECDIVSVGDANNSPSVNENSCGGGEQQNFGTEVVDQSVEGEVEFCAFKKAIRFSDGFRIMFEFDKDNQLLDVSGNGSPTPRSKAVQTSLKVINKKPTCEVLGVKSSVSHKSETVLCDDRNVVMRESDSCLENINDKTNQNSTCCKEKSLKTKIIGNKHIFSHANNSNMNLSNCSKNLFFQKSGSPNHLVDKRWKSCWDTEQRLPSSSVQEAVPDDKTQKSFCGVEQKLPSSSVQETTAEVHPQEIENNSKFSKDLGVALDITRSTVTAQNVFNTANCSSSDPCQRNSSGFVGKEVAPNYASSENCASAPVDPRTVKTCNRSNGHEVPLNFSRSINLLNTDSNSSTLYEVSLPQENIDAHGDRVLISANIFQKCVLAKSTSIGPVILLIKRLICRLAYPTTILRTVSQEFSLNIKYDYTLSSDTGHVCILSMDNMPVCKAYGESQAKARLEACKLAIYKLVELAIKTGIIHSNDFIHLLMWYNSIVPADNRFPLEDLNHNSALSGTTGPVATSEVVRQRIQKPEQSSSYFCPDEHLNAHICENFSQQICSAFVAILDYSDIAELEPSLCVLQVSAELNCVQLMSPCEVITSRTGPQIIRATIRCNEYDFSFGVGATKRIAIEIASHLALFKLRKTAYTIKMKYEHFDGFIIHHDQMFKATDVQDSSRRSHSEKENFRVRVKKIIENHCKTNPYKDLLFCAFNQKERQKINKIAEECYVKSYSIGGKTGCPKNIVISRFFTAHDLLRHLTETKDSSYKLRYEIIPPSEQ